METSLSFIKYYIKYPWPLLAMLKQLLGFYDITHYILNCTALLSAKMVSKFPGFLFFYFCAVL